MEMQMVKDRRSKCLLVAVTDLAPSVPHFLRIEIGGVSSEATGINPGQLPWVMVHKLSPWKWKYYQGSGRLLYEDQKHRESKCKLNHLELEKIESISIDRTKINDKIKICIGQTFSSIYSIYYKPYILISDKKKMLRLDWPASLRSLRALDSVKEATS